MQLIPRLILCTFPKPRHLLPCFFEIDLPIKLLTKGEIISEKSEGFLHLQLSKKNTPKHYPKLLHPVHGNDKILIKYNLFQVKKYYSYEM